MLPEGILVETFAASDHRVSPEDPHWPLVWLTLVSQIAVGSTIVATGTQLAGGSSTTGVVVSAALAVLALVGSLATSDARPWRGRP